MDLASRPARHGAGARSLLAIVLAAALAGCLGPEAVATRAPVASSLPAPTDLRTTPPATSGSSAEPGTPEPASEEPPVTPEPTLPPTPAPTEPATAGPTVSLPATGADACTGNDGNRDFFAAVAEAVDWAVLCPVLPAGWFVEAGSYRLAGGGKLAIAYTGPGGARLAIDEGAFCTDASGCVPAGSDAGAVALGGLEATLVELDRGGYAVVADRAATISWVVVASGLDVAAVTDIAAAFVEVDG